MADIAQSSVGNTLGAAKVNQIVDVANLFTNTGTKLLSSTLLSVDTASFTFTDIDQTYAQLRLVLYLRSGRVANSDTIDIRFNADSGTNYDHQYIRGVDTTLSGSIGNGDTSLAYICAAASSIASFASGYDLLIHQYAGTTFYKMVTGIGTVASNSTHYMQSVMGAWNSTSAITDIAITPETGPNWLTGSYAALYGMQ